MRASIIIPAYNAEHTLGACLAACATQGYPDYEIIVVDDGSIDGTAEIAGKIPETHVIRQLNQGPAAARNRGAREAAGEILAFTDADCVPAVDWLARILEGFQDGVVAVGGTYACVNPNSRLARVIQAEIAHRHGQFQVDVDFLGSFNVAYRADAFQAAGGFDESYRTASGEDNDLAYRLQDAGGRLRFARDAVVAHYHPERLLPYLRTQARHGFWRMKLYREHPRRAKGDQYAGLPDLLAPPLGLALLFLVPLVAAALGLNWHPPFILTVYGAAIALFLGLHAPTAWRLRRALPATDLLYFGWLVSLRDIARAIGLARGVWSFNILGRRA